MERIWTQNFGTALFVLLMAILAAFLPAIVVCIEYLIKNLGFYIGILHSLEEVFLGCIVVTISASLNYFESQYELNLGHICGALAALSVFAAILSLIGYFVAHFLHNDIFNPTHDNRWLVASALVLVGLGLLVSSAAVLQGRRMKDNRTLDDRK